MEEDPDNKPKTATDYIKTLNECDSKIVKLLRIHADAVRCLTAEGGNSKLTAEQRRAIFQLKMAEFSRLLADIRDTQHRAIHALRDTASGESGRVAVTATYSSPLLPTAAADSGTDGAAGDGDGKKAATALAVTTSSPRAILGELGDLDLSVLNANNDDVIRQVEAEQWAKAAELVQSMLEEKQQQQQQQQ